MSAAALLTAFLLQEVQISKDPFDPYVAVSIELPDSAFREQGGRRVDPFAYLSTFRLRDSGRIEHYLKLELKYVSLGAGQPIRVSSASYEGGAEADLEVIEATQTCTPAGTAYSYTEILSVRLPFTSWRGGALQVQFRDRGATWRGTVTVPAEVFAKALATLKTIK